MCAGDSMISEFREFLEYYGYVLEKFEVKGNRFSMVISKEDMPELKAVAENKPVSYLPEYIKYIKEYITELEEKRRKIPKWKRLLAKIRWAIFKHTGIII